jgi:lysophospholipase L1-like esterase
MKAIVAKLLAVLLGIAVGLAAAEIGVRIYYRTLPKVSAYRMNRRGYRDVEHALAKPAGTTRIAFVGDSYTFGAMVEFDRIFSSRTGELLRSLSPERSIEVLNFGVRGANIVRDLQRFKASGLRFDPDVVVLGFGLNDFTDPEATQRFDSSFRREEKRYCFLAPLERFSALARFVDWAAFQLFSREKKAHLAWLNSTFLPSRNPHFAESRRALDELTAIIGRRHGIVLFFPYLAAKAEDHLPYYREGKTLVQHACRANGCEFVEVWPLLKHKRHRAWWASPLDHHPNAEAHGIIARALAGIIQRKGLLDAVPASAAKERP